MTTGRKINSHKPPLCIKVGATSVVELSKGGGIGKKTGPNSTIWSINYSCLSSSEQEIHVTP